MSEQIRSAMSDSISTDDVGSPITASHSLVRRTQRAVREQTITSAECRHRSRRGAGLAVLVVSILLLALAPAIWIGFSWFREWESLADAAPQSVYILLCLLPVAFVLGIIGWRQRHHVRSEIRT